MDSVWKRIDTKTNKILLKSKLENNDMRNEKWENNEEEIRQDGFSKKFNDFNESYELQYWINKDTCDEESEIIEFNDKCKKWSLGKWVEENIILSINDNINFDDFRFIKDKNYNEERNDYLLTYKEKSIIFKTPLIDVEVINNFNNKCIRFQYNDMDERFINFIENLENRIIKCVNDDSDHFNIDLNKYTFNTNKKHKNDQNYIEFKVKKDSIADRTYNNATVYIKCNRLWKYNYKNRDDDDVYIWGVSLVLDKIVENN